MTKPEQIARLALARATMRGILVVIATDSQRQTIALLRSIEPKAVLSLVGASGVRIHGTFWGDGAKLRVAA